MRASTLNFSGLLKIIILSYLRISTTEGFFQIQAIDVIRTTLDNGSLLDGLSKDPLHIVYSLKFLWDLQACLKWTKVNIANQELSLKSSF